MKEKIRAILEKELDRISKRSEAGGLDLDAFRELDLLIKSYKTLLQELPDAPKDKEDTVEGLSEDELLEGVDEAGT